MEWSHLQSTNEGDELKHISVPYVDDQHHITQCFDVKPDISTLSAVVSEAITNKDKCLSEPSPHYRLKEEKSLAAPEELDCSKGLPLPQEVERTIDNSAQENFHDVKPDVTILSAVINQGADTNVSLQSLPNQNKRQTRRENWHPECSEHLNNYNDNKQTNPQSNSFKSNDYRSRKNNDVFPVLLLKNQRRKQKRGKPKESLPAYLPTNLTKLDKLNGEKHKGILTRNSKKTPNRKTKKVTKGKGKCVCEVCKKSFTARSLLESHMRSHTGEKPYVCHVCQRAYTTAGHLTRHMKCHPGVNSQERKFIPEKSENGEYFCGVCKKPFTVRYLLKRHMRSHTGEKPYMCDVCQAAFTTAGHLTRHKRCHTGEKPHVCSLCQRAFSYSHALKDHVKRQHLKQKPYCCELCEKSFVTLAEVRQHIKTHTGEKPFKCDICDKAFATSGYLTVHKRRHTGESCHRCDLCNKVYTRASALKNHIKVHHMKNVQ